MSMPLTYSIRLFFFKRSAEKASPRWHERSDVQRLCSHIRVSIKSISQQNLKKTSSRKLGPSRWKSGNFINFSDRNSKHSKRVCFRIRHCLSKFGSLDSQLDTAFPNEDHRGRLGTERAVSGSCLPYSDNKFPIRKARLFNRRLYGPRT